MPAPAVSTKLLYNDSPLIVLPQLAAAIGTDEALMLQQIHYWLTISGKERDGRLWIYNSYVDWTAQMPFWTKSKVARLVTRLRALGLIRVGNYNARRSDHTFWYSIDYAAVAALLPEAVLTGSPAPRPAAPGDPASGSAKSAPGASETPRSENETSRSENETPRSENETSRSESETPRSENETSRSENETSRSEIETTIPETTTETNAETSTQTNTERERERGAPAPPLPTIDNLTIDDAQLAWLAAECAQQGVPVAAIHVPRETATWRDDRRSKGRCPVDPASDWRLWMRRAVVYARAHPTPEVTYGPSPGPTRLVIGTIDPTPPGPAPAADGDAAADFLAALREAARARGVPC